MKLHPDLIRAIAVTAELAGTDMSPTAAQVFAEDLSLYPLPQVLVALTRCRREVKGRLCLADVISRLDDGRPGPEEAWAMLPRDEAQSGVWTTEMQRAFGVAAPLMEDAIAARMAFKEAYQREVQASRDKREPVKWTATLGHNPVGRDDAIHEATNRNLLAQGQRALPKIPKEEPRLLPKRSLQSVSVNESSRAALAAARQAIKG